MQDQWISGREVARRLNYRSSNRVPVIAEAAGIRRRVVPGLRTLYLAADVEKVLRESVVGGPALEREAACA